MPKFIRPEKGKRQRVRVVFADLDGVDQECDLRLLDAEDPYWIASEAAAEAKRRGHEAKPGNEAYDYAKDVYTLLRSAVDYESSLDDPQPFFASAKDIYKQLDRDRVHYLVMRQGAFQAAVSPLKHELTNSEFEALVHKAAAPVLEAGAPHPLSELALPLLRSFTAALAKQLLILRQFSSTSSRPGSQPTSQPTSGSLDSSAD